MRVRGRAAVDAQLFLARGQHQWAVLKSRKSSAKGFLNLYMPTHQQ